MLICEGEGVCASPNINIVSNLFTFTHPPTPQGGRIREWNADLRNDGVFKVVTGSFTIEKHCNDCLLDPDNLVIDGLIYVEFNVQIEIVPPLDGEDLHINFKGPFRIVGGTEFYSGIKGRGTINGTSHEHLYQVFRSDGGFWEGESAIDFVMLGEARF